MRLRIVLIIGLALVGLAGCGGEPSSTGPAASEPIPVTLSATGESARGQVVFETHGCMGCHTTGTDQMVGPGLAGSLSPAGPVHPAGVDYGGSLPNGQPRTEEAMAAWIRSGGQGKIGLMTPREMSDEDMADLLAYLRSLTR